MKCLTAMNLGWSQEVPPMLVPNNSTQNGSIAPPLILFAGVTIGTDVVRET